MRAYEDNIRHGFSTEERHGVTVLRIPSFVEGGFLRHCFTTRLGGVSGGCYASLNLSKTRENSPENKEENFRRACGAIGVSYDSLALVRYEHGNGVHCAAAEDAGAGIARSHGFAYCDALLVRDPGITAVTLHADCVPMFMADVKNRAAGVGHAGWKGVYLGLVPNMAQTMAARYGTRPEDLLVGIGPHIMDCCFEVQEDVAAPFAQSFGDAAVAFRGGRRYVNLRRALLRQLEACGVPAENVTCADLCTHCREDLFYSHRRDKGKTGAMGALISVCNPD